MSALVRSPRKRLAALAILAASGLGAAGYFAGLHGSVTAESTSPPIPANSPALVEANTLSSAFRASAERVLPAVVSIQHDMQPQTVQRELRAPRGGGQGNRPQLPKEFENNPLFKRFFEDLPGMDGMKEFDFGNPADEGRQSSGTGVIIDAAGIILTNNHVVGGGGKITVRLHDGREFVATEVLTDPSTDIAVVKIKAGGPLPFAKLGNSDSLQIGDWVLALGQPFGLEDTVTAGIISAKGRAVGITRHEEFLQTDAAINPGNSGGPLVNLMGEVIGINTAISSSSGGFQGIGFAVPVNVAKWVSTQLLKDGTVHRSYLGVGIQPVDQALADQLGMATPTGALVTDVQTDSPAAAAGVKSQDVIVEFGGTPIQNHRQLQAAVARSAVGSAVPMVVLRDGKRVTLSVTVREQPARYGERADGRQLNKPDAEASAKFDKFGLEVAPLTKDVADHLGMKDTAGVVITAVESGSAAEKAGLAPSMVIVQVGREAVGSVAAFEKAMSGASLDKGVMLLVRTEEGSRFMVLKSE
ncbi:MAG: Do family serine endopeptidase [Pirellulaceae bacterium]|nr:Do family serine endopeptidase [Pirellulaceae bacterium]